jgi:hypothetical protein
MCMANTQANDRILATVRRKVRRGKLKPADRQFSKAAAALTDTLPHLLALRRPSTDVPRLSRLLVRVEIKVTLFEGVAAKLRSGDILAAAQMVLTLTTHANRAKNLVTPFESKYCRFEPSRFT